MKTVLLAEFFAHNHLYMFRCWTASSLFPVVLDDNPPMKADQWELYLIFPVGVVGRLWRRAGKGKPFESLGYHTTYLCCSTQPSLLHSSHFPIDPCGMRTLPFSSKTELEPLMTGSSIFFRICYFSPSHFKRVGGSD